MFRPAPQFARLLAAAGLATVAGAWVAISARNIGASPFFLCLALAPTGLALSLTGAWSRASASVSARTGGPFGRLWGSFALLLLPLGMGGAGWCLGTLGTMSVRADFWSAVVLLCATLLTLSGAAAAQRAWTLTSPAPLADGAGALAGITLALLLPAWMAGAVASVLLGLASRVPCSARPPSPDAGGIVRAMPVALAAMAVIFPWLHLRALADPTALGALTVLGVAIASAALTRQLAPARLGTATLAAAGSLVVAWLLTWKGPGLARVLVLRGVADADLLPEALLRLLPLAVTAMVSGSALGIAWGRRAAPSTVWLGPVAALLLLNFVTVPSWALLWLAGVVSATAVLWSLHRDLQVAGVALAAGCVWLAWTGSSPDLAALTVGAWPLARGADAALVDLQSRAKDTVVMRQLGPSGTVMLRVPTRSWDVAHQRPIPGAAPTRILEQDGLITESFGRAADAELLAGHLAGLLSPNRNSALVLGDDQAQVLSGLVPHDFTSITVSTPQPIVVRALAEVTPQLRAVWLEPRVQLAALAPGPLLATHAPVDAIVEVMRAPWSDSVHVAPTPEHLRMVSRRLEPDGLYVLVLHLGWVDSGGAPALAAQVCDRFPYVQAWLPPTGADSLVLVAGQHAVPLQRLVQRLEARPSPLKDLSAAEPEDLASLAVTDRAGLLAWRDAGRNSGNRASPSPLMLSHAVSSRPVMHLATLANHLAETDRIWQVADAERRARLDLRAQARKSFLRLLGEASAGNMEAVFNRARELQQAGGSLGAAALEPLIEPHLSDGRLALAKARKTGPASTAWDDALRYATTARMLAPTSPRPIVLLGDIALARGKVTSADDLYAEALKLDPVHVPALTGLARAARARGDRSKAIELLRRATTAAPGDWRMWQNLGVMLTEERQRDEGEEALRQAVLLTDGHQAAPQLALAELMLDDGRPGAALLTAEDALAITESGYGWYLRGRAHYDLGESERAEEDFQRAVIADPALAEARAGVGLIQAERGDLKQAAETFQAVLRLRPSDGAVRENLKRIEEDLAAREASSSPRGLTPQ